MLNSKAFWFSNFFFCLVFGLSAQLPVGVRFISGTTQTGIGYSNLAMSPKLNVNPQFGKMVSDNWFVLADARVGLNEYNLNSRCFMPNEIPNKFKTLATGASVGLGYIFNPEKELKFYTSAQVNVDNEKPHSSMPFVYNKIAVGTTLRLGVLKQLNPEMMLDANIGYTYQRAIYQNENNGIARDEQDLVFQVGFRNIVPLHRSTEKTPPQYLAAGRSIIGGNLTIRPGLVDFNANYAHFLTKNLSVGASAFFNAPFAGYPLTNGTNFGLTAEARYYQPITKRLSAYGSAALSVERGGVMRTTLGAGFNYFISKRVALDVNLLNTSFGNKGQRVGFVGSKVKLSFFLK